MGDHMPVHLGSMPMSVQAAVAAIAFAPGDIAILNDPFAGGTHLPDITMVLPVFLPGQDQPAFYVSNIGAHHADVGGMFAGSMGPANEIFQEGIRIPPVRIVRGGRVDREMLNLILLNVRTAKRREGDLESQIGACRVGEQRVLQLVEKYGESRLQALIEELLDYSERLVRAELRSMPPGDFSAEDWLDGDGVSEGLRKIAVRLRFDPEAGALDVDFTGSSDQVAGSVNAVRAITLSACFYMLRCLLGEDAPATAGILRPLTLHTPPGEHRGCATPCASRRRQRRNLAAHCGCVAGRSGAGGSGARAGSKRRHHEQFDYWRCGPTHRRAVRLLLDGGRWHGGAPRTRWHLRCADAHDQFAEHPHRSAGVCLSIPSAPLRLSLRISWGRPISWRRWIDPGSRAAPPTPR